MQLLAIELCLLNFLLIGLLPLVFFQRGRLNARWWFTALPLFLSSAGLLAAGTGVWDVVPDPPLALPLAMLGVLLSAVSIAGIAYAAGSHAAPVALWHQPQAVPSSLVTARAYRRIRHPLYGAFALALVSAVLCVPAWPMLLIASWGIVALNLTARAEERTLLATFGEDYRAYMARSGRLLPRWRR